MKPTAIVYTSNTGCTAQYASLLGGETGLRVYPLEDAMKNLPQGSPVIYLGWLAAGAGEDYSGDLKELVAASHGALEGERI